MISLTEALCSASSALMPSSIPRGSVRVQWEYCWRFGGSLRALLVTRPVQYATCNGPYPVKTYILQRQGAVVFAQENSEVLGK